MRTIKNKVMHQIKGNPIVLWKISLYLPIVLLLSYVIWLFIQGLLLDKYGVSHKAIIDKIYSVETNGGYLEYHYIFDYKGSQYEGKAKTGFDGKYGDTVEIEFLETMPSINRFKK